MPSSAAQFVELLAQLRRKQFGKRRPRRLRADAGQPLDLRVPAFHAVVETGRQYADVDRFDDVFAELLQPLVFVGFALQRTVEPRIFDRDRNVVRQRHQQFDIVARQEIAFGGPAHAEIRDRPAARLTGDVISEIEFGDGSRTDAATPAKRCRANARGARRTGKARRPLPPGNSDRAALERARSRCVRISASASAAGTARCFIGQEERQPVEWIVSAAAGRTPWPASRSDRFPSSARAQTRSACSARIVAIPVKDLAVQLLLNPAPDRLEDEGRKRNQHDESRAA